MKKLYVLSTLLVLGCSNHNNEKNIEKNETSFQIDSIIQQSQKNLSTVDSANKKSDSTITGKVEKTVKQITTLKEENKQLKIENNALKTQLNDINTFGEPFKLLPVSNN